MTQVDHVLPLEPRARVIVAGKTGNGKSYFAKALCAGLLAIGARVLVFDPHDEYSVRGTPIGPVDKGPLRDRCTYEELILEPSRLDDPELSLSVIPSDCDDGPETAEEFTEVSRLVKLTQVRNNGETQLVWLLEEVGEWGLYCQPRLNTVATQYRHYAVAVVLCAQRLTAIPKTARVQASQIVSFLQDDDLDVEALYSRFGKDTAESVRHLGVGQSIHWRDSQKAG